MHDTLYCVVQQDFADSLQKREDHLNCEDFWMWNSLYVNTPYMLQLVTEILTSKMRRLSPIYWVLAVTFHVLILVVFR